MFGGYRNKKGWNLAYTFSADAIKQKISSDRGRIGYQKPAPKEKQPLYAPKGGLAKSQSMMDLHSKRPNTAM